MSKLLAAISITIWILNSGITKYVFGNQSKFIELVNYKNSYHITNKK